MTLVNFYKHHLMQLCLLQLLNKTVHMTIFDTVVTHIMKTSQPSEHQRICSIQ